MSSIVQRTQAQTGSTPWTLPNVSGNPVTPSEIREGDVVQAVAAPYSGTYPAVTGSTLTDVLAGVPYTHPYTIPTGAAGSPLVVNQVVTNALGSTQANSTPVTITAPKNFGVGMRGGVIDAGVDYVFGYFTNAFFDSRGFGIQNSYAFRVSYSPGSSNLFATVHFSAATGSGVTATFSTLSGAANALTGTSADVGRVIYLGSSGGGLNKFRATVTAPISTTQCTVTITAGAQPIVALQEYTYWQVGIPLDSNGWPTGPSEVVLCAPAGDGTSTQLTPGTYWGQFKAPLASTCIALSGGSGITPGNTATSGGVTIDNVSQTYDGTNYVTTFRIQTALLTVLWFTGGIVYASLPRITGLSGYQSVYDEFWAPTLDYYGYYSSFRLLGMNNGIGSADTVWSSRQPEITNIANQGASGVRQYSWETVFRLMNAIYARPNSQFQMLWIQPGPYIQTVSDGVSSAEDYARNLALLVNSYPLNSGIRVEIEIGNEPWNSSSKPVGVSILNQYQYNAVVETKLVTNYSFVASPGIAPVTNLSSNGTTATATLSALPSYLTPNGTYQGFIYSTDTNWKIGTAQSLITFTVNSAGTAITWPTTQTGGGATSQVLMFLNGASDLLGDNWTYISGVNDLSYKWYTRAVYRAATSWKAVRPTDRFKLNLQQFGTTSLASTSNAGSTKFDVHFQYGDWLGQHYNSAAVYKGLATWLDAVAIAPYMQLSSAQGATLSTTDSVAGLNSLFGTSSDTGTGTLWGCLLNFNTYAIRSLVYMCNVYGIRPQAYEGGSDVQNAASVTIGGIQGNYQVLMRNDPRIGTLYTALLTTWFANGGKEFHVLDGSPNPWVPKASCWGITNTIANAPNSYSWQAYTGYSVSESFANSGGTTLDVTVATTLTLNANTNSTSTPPLLWRSNSTLVLQVDFLLAIPRSGRYSLTLIGSTNATGTSENTYIYVDNVAAALTDTTASAAGVVHVAPNGAASGAVTCGPASNTVVVNLTSGVHTVSVRTPGGQGGTCGYAQVLVALSA